MSPTAIDPFLPLAFVCYGGYTLDCEVIFIIDIIILPNYPIAKHTMKPHQKHKPASRLTIKPLLLAVLSALSANAVADSCTGSTTITNGQTVTTRCDLNNNESVIIQSGGIIALTPVPGSGWGAIYVDGTSTVVNNVGNVSGDEIGLRIASGDATITNSGTILGNGGSVAIYVPTGTINSLINTGTISSAPNYGIWNDSIIVNLENYGTISGFGGGGATDIYNTNTITTLINAQGASSSALRLDGNVPTNYKIYVRSTTDYGKLAVTNPNGTMTFGVATGSTLTSNRYTSILTGVTGANITGALTGTLGAYNWSLLQPIMGTWDLLVTGGGGGATSFVAVSNNTSRGVATVLDSAPAGLSGPIATLNGMTPAEQTAALKRIAPETSRAVGIASSQTISGALDTVRTRLESVRENGFRVGLVDDLRQGKLKVAAGGNLAGLVDADGSKKRGFWMKGFGGHGNQDQKDNFAGYNSNTLGMSFGADTLLESNWVVGGALTFARTDVNMDDFRNGDDTNIKTYQLTGYATRNFGNWYAEGMVAYAKQKYDSSRDTTVSGIAKGKFDGDQLAARANVGLPFALNDTTTLTPMAGLEWSHLKQDGYTETGAGALSMVVQDETANRVRSVLGAKLATEKALSNGLTLLPSLHATWRHDFRNNGIDSTSTFTGGGASFTTPGQDLARNTYNLGAALAFQKSQDFTLTLQLDGERASGYSAVSGQVIGQWLF
jgi:outer membrane autotransporter protein